MFVEKKWKPFFILMQIIYHHCFCTFYTLRLVVFNKIKRISEKIYKIIFALFKINNFSPFFYKKKTIGSQLVCIYKEKKINEYQRKYNESHLHCLTFLFFKKKKSSNDKKKYLKILKIVHRNLQKLII